MQKYRELAKLVEEIYQDSGSAFNSFQSTSGLSCLSGCGACCLNPDVTATQLEMLPFAIYLIDHNLADDMLNKLECTDQKFCINYIFESEDGKKGKCGIYQYRPSLCRSFGASTRFNKNFQKEWVICKFIKENSKELIPHIDIERAPIMGSFAARIKSIDYELSKEIYPINDALRKMLEKLMFYRSFQFNNPLATDTTDSEETV